MWRHLLILFIIGYLPGAVLFRLPLGNRHKRAGLDAEERAYWAVMLSVIVTTTIALLLAWMSVYTLERVLMFNVAFAVLLAIGSLGNLRLGTGTPRVGWTAVIPAALIAIGGSMYFAAPASEYIVGGRDPGVYMNEGVQIAQKRSLVTSDPIASEVKPPARDLFSHPTTNLATTACGSWDSSSSIRTPARSWASFRTAIRSGLPSATASTD